MKEEIRNYLKSHQRLINEFESNSLDTIVKISEAIVNSIKNEGTVYLCGNGGSAADAQHIAGEFVGRFSKNRKALPAVSLSTDTSVLTCIGNDFSFDDIFLRQIEALIHGKDILWVFSTSGSSRNIIKAARAALEKKAKLIAFTGKKNSELEKISDICLSAGTEVTSLAQEIHQTAYHLICKLIDNSF
ncbi:MAG: D-sedoheptulose-7-phosphate isomerase [Candidatus Humimicrobiaceae bacterium]